MLGISFANLFPRISLSVGGRRRSARQGPGNRRVRHCLLTVEGLEERSLLSFVLTSVA